MSQPEWICALAGFTWRLPVTNSIEMSFNEIIGWTPSALLLSNPSLARLLGSMTFPIDTSGY